VTSREEPVPDGHKVCPGCGLVRPAEQFHRNRATRDGLQPYCRGCARDRRPRWPGRLRAAANRAAVEEMIRRHPTEYVQLVRQHTARIQAEAERHQAERVGRPSDLIADALDQVPGDSG
jgi:hypothetical protein